MDILNYYQNTDCIALAGQPSPEKFKEIAEQGYDVVINLAMPEHKHSIRKEGSLVATLGMIFIHIPVPFDAPNEDQYREFMGYMDALKDKKVWAHCIVNARVSGSLFRYLQDFRGFSAQQAASLVLEAWLPEMDDVWKAFINCAPERLYQSVSATPGIVSVHAG